MTSSKLPQWLYKSEFLDIWFGSQLGSHDIDYHPNLKVSKAKLRKFVQVTDIIRNKARNLNSFLLFCALFLNQVHHSGIVIVNKQTNKKQCIYHQWKIPKKPLHMSTWSSVLFLSSIFFKERFSQCTESLLSPFIRDHTPPVNASVLTSLNHDSSSLICITFHNFSNPRLIACLWLVHHLFLMLMVLDKVRFISTLPPLL